MNVIPILTILMVSLSVCLPGCNTVEGEVPHHESAEEHAEEGHGHEANHKILVTSPVVRDVVSTQQYVCQIHSRQRIEVRALESGYLGKIPVNEGQLVKEGDLLFQVVPVLFKARLDTEIAEAQQAQIEYNNTESLFKKGIVAEAELQLANARLAKAQAKVNLARAELNFTEVRAPFDGLIDRLLNQKGSLVAEGDSLTTLSDNEVMWVYFNVPESRYLEYKSELAQHHDELQVELVLANGKTFPQVGKIGAIEAEFNNETGNIAFRADFPNPDRLLRHGQTGNILIHTTLKDALVIPQRATFEILAKQYVYVVGDDHVVHQRDITVETEQDDIYVLATGLQPGETIILEGIRQVRDGDKVEVEFQDPETVLANLKFKAE